MRYLLISIFLLFTFLQTINAAEQLQGTDFLKIHKDFENGQTEAYLKDNYGELTAETLSQQNIYKGDFVNNMSAEQCTQKLNATDVLSSFHCPALGDGYLSSIASIDENTFTLKCAVVKADEKRIPIGYFNYQYKNCSGPLRTTDEAAMADEQIKSGIASSKAAFKTLLSTKKDIEDTMKSDVNNEYLNSIQVLVAVVSTNSDIINVDATTFQGKIVLNEGYTSIYRDENGQTHDSTEVFQNTLNSVFQVYLRLVSSSMGYFAFLVGLALIWGVGGFVGRGVLSKIEGVKDTDLKGVWFGTLIIGLLLIIPTSESETVVTDSKGSVEYKLFHNQIQDFQNDLWRNGLDWADGVTKEIIDIELDTMINNAGFANEDEIIAGTKSLYNIRKKYELNGNLLNECTQKFPVADLKKLEISDNKNRTFPISEKYLYGRMAFNYSRMIQAVGNTWAAGNVPPYYNTYENRGFYEGNEAMSPVLMSACASFESNVEYYSKQYDDQYAAYSRRIQNYGNAQSVADKISKIQGLIKFQYELYRDFGFASILALPIIKMQVEALDSTPKHDLQSELTSKIKKDSLGAHAIMSSIPYTFIPGMGTVYNIAEKNSGELGAVIGATSGGGVGSWASAAIGYIAGKGASGAVGLSVTYQTAKAILEIAPLVSILGIGIARLVVIVGKILIFHFSTIFALPVIFLQKNSLILGEFITKFILLMIEIPVFALSIWLAITMYKIIQSLGMYLAKYISVGLLEANTLVEGSWFDKIKLYLYDGFVEVAVSLLSIVIIYKIIVTTHTALFELLETKSTTALDNITESMKQDAGGMGSKF